MPLSDSRDNAPFSTKITRGYAHAMFRLGTRYEVRHNEDEAVRCYDKSSRLGDARATAKLDEIPIANAVEDDNAPATVVAMPSWYQI